MAEEKGFNGRKLAVLLLLFLISYGIAYAFSGLGEFLKNIPIIGLFFPMHSWDSPTYFLLPIAGFFLFFLGIEWINETFHTKFAESGFFPAVFFFFSLIAYWVAVFFYYINIKFAGRDYIVCVFDCENLRNSLLPKIQEGLAFINFWDELKISVFMYFVIACILGWASFKAMKMLEEKNYF